MVNSTEYSRHRDSGNNITFLIHADNEGSIFHYCPLVQGQVWKIFTEYSLEVWESSLSQERYCRLHRSYIVCIHFVDTFEPAPDGHGGEVLLTNGLRYRVSRKYLPSFHRATKFRFASAAQKRNYRRKNRAGGGGQKTEEKVKGTKQQQA